MAALNKEGQYFPVRLVTGPALGLFLARVIAEATRAPWSPLSLAALVVALCAAFVWLVRWLDRRGRPLPLAPMLVLLVYVFWPQHDWNVALIVAAIALLSWLLGISSRIMHHVSRFTLLDLVTFLITLVIYLATLQKDILPADSGEFQVTVTMLGVLHQPGYPLYTLVGKLFTLLPIGTPALRLNLMSVFLAAGTLTLVGATVRRMVGTPPSCHSERSEESLSRKTETLRRSAAQGDNGVWGGLAAVLALGTATTFWAQATTANIRMPTAFFTALCLYALVTYRQSLIADRQPHDTQYPTRNTHHASRITDRYLVLFALAFSLGLGHYFPLAVMGLFFAAYLVLVDPSLVQQPRRWWRPTTVFVLAQLVWLYLPIHAAIAPTPETRGLTTLSGFLWYAMGQGFGGDFLAFAGPEYLPSRLALLPTLFPFQMNLALLVVALVGAALLMCRNWRTGLMLVGVFVLYTFIAITYRAPQTVEYAMPTYVVLAVMIGYAVGQISNTQYPISNVLVAGVVVAGLANGVSHAPSYITLANDRSTREYVEPILRDAPSDSIILADWHYFTPMRYLQQVEGLRPDVEVYDVYPVGGQEISQVWRNRIEENVARRPVIVMHYWGLQYSTMPYIFESFHQAWLVRDKPSFVVPRDLTPISVEFDGKIRLVGSRTLALAGSARVSQTSISPGRTLDVMLALQSIGQLDRDYALTVQLMDSNGGRRTQRDRGYPTRTFMPGEVRVDRVTLPLEPTLPPGQYAVKVGVYYVPPEGGFRNLTIAGGAQLATVATLDLVTGQDALPTLHPLDVPFAGGPTLAGVDYDLSNPSSLRVYLHWRGPGPAGVIARIGDAIATLPELSRGAVFVTGHDAPVAGPLRLVVTGADGHAWIGAGAWGWPMSELELPAFRSGDRYVMLSDQMALMGVESPHRRVAPGQPIDVTLRFLSLKPLVTGDVVSVRVEGENAAWRQAGDDRPAANAIPTLKWIAGSIVDDQRRLTVPADAKPGRALGHLKVYDEFREDILPPLDARMGDDVPLGEWNVER